MNAAPAPVKQSIPADEIEEFSRKQGFLALRLYVIFTRPTNGIAAVEQVSEAHLIRQLQLERDAVLFAAGPLLSEDGEHCSGEGMIIIRAVSLEEAHAIAQADPMHKTGARTYEIRPWILNEGSISFTVKLSSSRSFLT